MEERTAPPAPPPGLEWRIRGRTVALNRPVLLGIVNVTPDSFSDGGNFFSPEAALARAEALVEEGADILDVGGESTRPQGATPVDSAEETRRVLPVVRELARRFPDVPVSVDTVKAAVGRAALDAGAAVVNDVSAFRLDPELAEVCAAAGAGVILMHSRGGVSEMGTYRYAEYGPDPAGEVVGELRERVREALASGVRQSCIAVDPGVGFSKRSEHSLRVLAELPRLVACGMPVVVGASRKRFVGEITRVSEPRERVNGTVGANVAALMLGARLFRVHDVRASREALDVAWAVLTAGAAPATAR